MDDERTVMLVCNYRPDGQESMLRFGDLLGRVLPARGFRILEIRAEPRAIRWLQGLSGRWYWKWAGYVDKYLIFPRELKRRIREEAMHGPLVIHAVDHANAVYAPDGGSVPWVITCHDLLAVRGALGDDTDCPASAMGRRLQRSIAGGLARASAVACDSMSTLGDLERIVKPRFPQIRRRILLPLNHPYRPIERADALERLGSATRIPWSHPFLLHVGSNLARKNKGGVIRVLKLLGERWAGNVVFCGPELPADLRAEAERAGLGARVFALVRPGNASLEAAYSLAHALVFPSKCEGFGWPIIEAQACGCPVICSDRTSLPEVGGEAALVHRFDDEAGMADSVLRLTDPGFRASVVLLGFKNLERFRDERLIEDYCDLYADVLNGSATA